MFGKDDSEVQINNPENIIWKFKLNNVDITNNRNIIVEFDDSDNQSLGIKLLNDSRLVGKLIDVECMYEEYSYKAQVSITH